MVSLGVLAVAVPLVMATVAGAAGSDADARADSVAGTVAALCLQELRAAKRGEGRWLTSTDGGLPPAGETRAIGFSMAGEPIGEVVEESYRAGCRDAEMVYLAGLTCEPPTPGAGAAGVRITFEFPAAARMEKRQRLEFVTSLP
jgi:hypothetical protein